MAAVGLVAGATCIATAPLFVRGLEELGAAAIGAYRTAIAAVILYGAASFTARARRAGPRPPTGAVRALLAWCGVCGVVFAMDLYVWHRSVLLVGAGMGTILGNTQVFYVGLVGLLFLRERWSWRYGLSVPLAFGGIGMLVGFDAHPGQSDRYWEGVAFGLATGVVYAAYILVLRRLQAFTFAGPALILAMVCTVTAALMAGVALVDGSLALPRAGQWLLVVGLGVVAQVCGWYLISRFLPRVDASRAGLILLLQPVLATLGGALLFGERMRLVQLAGAGLTLVAVYLGATRRSAPT